MKVKANVLEIANKEEEKLQFAEFVKEADEARKKNLTYEKDKIKEILKIKNDSRLPEFWLN